MAGNIKTANFVVCEYHDIREICTQESDVARFFAGLRRTCRW